MLRIFGETVESTLQPRKKLSADQREILVGLLLGDASLETQTKGQTWRLLIEHSFKQKEYLEHKYEIFKEFVETPPKEKDSKRVRDLLRTSKEKQPSLPSLGLASSEAIGKTTINLAFKTTVQPSLRFYAQQFYQQNPDFTFTKKVPKQIGKWLTPKGLAYWYMDDGSMKSKDHKAVYLNTQGFVKKDVDLLCEVLQMKFDLECKPKKRVDKRSNKVSYQIGISGGPTFEKLEELILPYILPSMVYKFPPSRKKRE